MFGSPFSVLKCFEMEVIMKIKVKPRIQYTEGREMFDRPEGIIDCAREIDGVLRSWKEFIPSGYDESREMPLVVTLHGGSSKRGGNNHRAELSTAWAAVAEREGFIVLYPQSLTTEHTWSAWEDFSDRRRTEGLKDDIRYINLLLELIQEKYRIDTERIYLHGQSFGDVMGTYYLLNSPKHPFAAAATLSGPVGAERLIKNDGNFCFDKECALPMVRTHGSLDLAMPMGTFQHIDDIIPTFDLMRELKKKNGGEEEMIQAKMEMHQLPCIELWKHCNSCSVDPVISVRGRYNALTYSGEYDFHFYSVEKGGHGPSMDMADFIWTYFFSGYRRINGRVVKSEPDKTFQPDSGSVALADGAVNAYVDNKLVFLPGAIRKIGDVFYAPSDCISRLYPQLTVSLEEGGASAVISDGSREMQVSACNKTYVWCGYLNHGERTLMEDDTLLIPIAQVGGRFYGQKAKCGYGVCYLSRHDGVLTYDFAYLVRQLLGTERILSTQEMWEKANRLLKAVAQPGDGA